MVEIQSKEVIDKISDELKIQPALNIPRNIGDKIELVYNVNAERIVNFMSRASSASTGTTTIHTAHATKDDYLTSIHYSFIADGTADNLNFVLTITPRGLGAITIRLNKATTTAFTKDAQIIIDPPILLERSSGITMGTTFTVGTATKEATAWGYQKDPL